ncbi:HAD-IA family hydrolase [Desulforegula conservatrix]|uniref:HAD-IA family hydrolase n=1 Tax=Desulforegula conservatrix TaxID=153026 RepID=UPI00047FB720|nr:HAD-IA family hydrolase [Desulforegula conservatrix]
MTISGLLIDLDGTLVNTSEIDELRLERLWNKCKDNLHKTQIYNGISELLRRAKDNNIAIGVVTSSISNYAINVLNYHQIKYDILIAYHDVNNRKPHPEPYLLAVKKLNLDITKTIGIGDSADDAISLKCSGIFSYGAGWNENYCRISEWGCVVSHPSQIEF